MTLGYLSSFSSMLTGRSELRGQTNLTHGVTISGGKVTLNQVTEESGIFARVWENGVYGACSFPGFEEESIKSAIITAGKNAKVLAGAKKAFKPLPEIISAQKAPAPAIFMDVLQKDLLDYALGLDEQIQKKYSNLSNRLVRVVVECTKTQLFVTHGVSMERVLPRAHIFVTLTTKDDMGHPVVITGKFGGGGNFADHFNKPEDLGDSLDELYNMLMDKKEGVYPEAKMCDIILDANLAGIFAHEAIGHTTESDLVRSGSIAHMHLNEEIASKKVTLTDFAHTAFGKEVPLPIYIDDEGTPAQDVVIIKDGILRDYMTNQADAPYIGAVPKGNGRAFSYSDEPLVRMRNTCILPGSDKLEDMIASIDDGYYLMMYSNGQADSTSEFMFGINMGYKIENGKLGKAIRDTTISGVAFDVLKTVDMVGTDISWSASGYCGKKTRLGNAMGGPAIKCRLKIGGR